eukprot:GHVU01203350.1.p1 GENE.GHVU01203350.1~~GHVU01203350.1.p1  ORF type:complete len:165 (-),score=15.94 GHVU01203350.1:600-1094(-)
MVACEACWTSTYLEVCIDDQPPFRVKSTGFLVCTGTGSSAWGFNISRLRSSDTSAVCDAVVRMQPEEVQRNMILPDVEAVTTAINRDLLFHPSVPKMRYVVREPIENRVFTCRRTSGFCQRVRLRPLTPDTSVYLDGGSLRRPLPMGSEVVLESETLSGLQTGV